MSNNYPFVSENCSTTDSIEQGYFISFEGINGAGKSTCTKWLAQYLKQEYKIPVFQTREPGGTNEGAALHELLEKPSLQWSPMTQVLLYFTARYLHVETYIRPQLKQGTWVICDRFIDSTLVYQGDVLGVGVQKVNDLHRLILDDLYPHLTFILDVTPEIAQRRRIEQAGQLWDDDQYERRGLEFQTRLREGYLTLAQQNTYRYTVLDSTLPQATVQKQILETISTPRRVLDPRTTKPIPLYRP